MKIIHLSDLHFGTESGPIVEHLKEGLRELHPDLVIISGDFTQIASRAEFEKARLFINALAAPVFCIPGNHDIPRYKLIERFTDPYRRYRNYICNTLSPVFENEECVIAGLNSARRILPHWNWANGAVSPEQLRFLEKSFAKAGEKRHICVLHHPLHRAEGVPLDVTVFGKQAALRKMVKLGVDLVLTGHVHHASVTQIEKTVFASASTALSTRLRQHENGFNCIILSKNALEIAHYIYDRENFLKTDTHFYKH